MRETGEGMNSTPHFVLFSRTGEQTSNHGTHGGSWHFRLESSDGDFKLEAYDVELEATRERLELLSVVRGLEALDQPSEVTLVTSSRQIARAVRQGLEYWRSRNWMWERFGEKVPMKNGDLWKRVDAALQIHSVRCRTYRLDPRPESTSVHRAVPTPKFVSRRRDAKQSQRRSLMFRPVVSVVRRTARSLQTVSEALLAVVPDAPGNPHLT